MKTSTVAALIAGAAVGFGAGSLSQQSLFGGNGAVTDHEKPAWRQSRDALYAAVREIHQQEVLSEKPASGLSVQQLTSSEFMWILARGEVFTNMESPLENAKIPQIAQLVYKRSCELYREHEKQGQMPDDIALGKEISKILDVFNVQTR